MRANHRSYVVESSGEAYVAPYSSQVHFDTHFAAPSAAGVRNPFAPRANRVARRLLLDPSESFSVQQLSELTEVDNGHVSRTVATLADRGFVEVTRPQRDERRRLIHLVSPLGLLEDWLQYWRRAQPIAYRLDIGTRSFEETVRAIADAAEPSTPYAISGLAGAAFVRRVVEPTNVLLLTVKTGLERWSELLLARRERQGRGLARVAAVQDDFIFKLVHLERRFRSRILSSSGLIPRPQASERASRVKRSQISCHGEGDRSQRSCRGGRRCDGSVLASRSLSWGQRHCRSSWPIRSWGTSRLPQPTTLI